LENKPENLPVKQVWACMKICLHDKFICANIVLFGAIAQMGERLHGMQEVVGSNPIGSIFLIFSAFFYSARCLLKYLHYVDFWLHLLIIRLARC
jgi:hypothetical protein